MNDTPTSPPPARPARPRRGLRIALILSLAVNLLLIGVMAGGVMRYGHRPPASAAQTDFRSLWRALPAEARSDLRDAMRGPGGERSARPDPEERRARAARTNAEIIALLRADPFDAAGFATLLDGDRAGFAQRLQAARQAFVARVAALTPPERRAMAAELEQAWEDRLPGR